MRSPLSSRRNNRPERVALDEAIVLVAWCTVMVYPFVSQLRFDPPRRGRNWRGSEAGVDDGGAAQSLADRTPLGDLEQPQSLVFGEITVETDGAIKMVDRRL